ncbi:DMT family transporter [Marivivens aquimaris]|uniref:DMT family transporter n=1 Tax=Marivivens aquimaris TaxID=2774876 RepID=UPI001D16256F|nr:DMT family transporter [Marivivens aquimaris]
MSAMAEPNSRNSSTFMGMAAMSFAMVLLPIGDSVTKTLTAYIEPSQIAAIRSVIQAGLLWIAFAAMNKSTRGNPFTKASAASGICVAVVSLSLITALKTIPLPTAIAIFFVEPLLLTLLAGLMLGEKPGPHRYAAIVVGLIGVLIILRPNFSVFGPAVLLPLVSAAAYALNMIITRKGTRNCSALTFQLGSTTFTCLTLMAVMLFNSDLGALQETITFGLSASLVLSGILAAATFPLIAYAFSQAEASVLAPFQYLEILGATAIGFLVFGDVPDGLTVLGTAVVLSSGLYIFHRERRANQPAKAIKVRQDR